jgi:hypothetical protein
MEDAGRFGVEGWGLGDLTGLKAGMEDRAVSAGETALSMTDVLVEASPEAVNLCACGAVRSLLVAAGSTGRSASVLDLAV